MKAIHYLSRSEIPLSPEEESLLSQELASAYHQDETSATSREVERIAEKIKARMTRPAEPEPPSDNL
ncbi:MAG: hypothetical protein QM680_11160 [Luteolibacter sp.]